MAMWQFDAFSNDDALDFIGVLGMLSDSKKIALLRDALETGVSSTTLDIADTCGAIAAAALVAIQLTPLLMPEDTTIEEVLGKLPDVASLKQLAQEALSNCLNSKGGEWHALLKERHAIEEMQANLQPYLNVLST